MGLSHRVHLGESVIFMLNSLFFVMQVFLYWSSSASIALEVWHSLMKCLSSCAGGTWYASEN